MGLLDTIIKEIKENQHIKPLVIYFSILVGGGALVYLAMQFFIVQGLNYTIDNLTKDRDFYHQQNSELREQLAKNASENEHKNSIQFDKIISLYQKQLNDYEIKNKQLSQIVESQKNQLAEFSYNAKLASNNNREKNISVLKKDLAALDYDIKQLYSKQSLLGADYGYSQKECDKENPVGYSNTCEQASKTKYLLESVNEQIKSQLDKRKFMQEELLSIQKSNIN
ncbi:hypothetical protein KW811_11530 [Enterobacter quasiroggenkampii]|uniref:hypothetical protein n=1 Tax=Enterobacter quasiroggenkampii TaxID=2497436 RepID=UPI0021D31BED|nr:hypothetical protein [Enterobacter quasiroggenkampii]MCU6399108.1 hypothetical protein [Enterobacter quasiroggenkampii]